MIKMAEFCSVAGTVNTPGIPLLQQHGLVASPSWNNSGRKRMLSSSLSAGSFQGL